MQQYHDLLANVLRNGVLKPTRAKLLSTGRNVSAYSVFGAMYRYDLSVGFPMATTKKLPFKAIAAELAWFLRGDSNIQYLRDRGVTIWDEWADEKGDLGPVYGVQWRSWGNRGIDQIQNVLDDVRLVMSDPTASIGRRLMVSAWNVEDIKKMALPPCHCMVQFNVVQGFLDCLLYQRSADAFLGVPFNIASYALLTEMIAREVGLQVGDFIHAFGDLHIYENHVAQVEKQLEREPYDLPRLVFADDAPASIFDLTPEHMRLEGYRHHPHIPGEVAV